MNDRLVQLVAALFMEIERRYGDRDPKDLSERELLEWAQLISDLVRMTSTLRIEEE